ncbi:hypothetical protein GIB67_013352, partial [Kingdonia uniflora]
ASWSSRVFNVMKYGAIADGKTDSAKAFLWAWKDACAWWGKGTVWIPKGTYLAGPMRFEGPCNGPTVFVVQGTVKAPTNLAVFDSDTWIRFIYIHRLMIRGGGTFDGQGASAWPYNKCTKYTDCKTLPITLQFDFITDATVRGIHLINSKFFHIQVFQCQKMKFRALKIFAPEDSPNTDGIHIGSSTGIRIYNSIIGTGDDCISLGPGSKDILISNVHCGPGHGISVGSLGRNPNEEDVNGLIVRNCTFSGTGNGVRIKTWAPSPSSMARNFTFEHIFMNNVYNPIVIDQQYCPYKYCNQPASSQVQISDVKFRNIWGNSLSKLAVNLLCSQGQPCQNIELRDIYLPYNGVEEHSASSCIYVNGFSYGKQIPPSCF